MGAKGSQGGRQEAEVNRGCLSIASLSANSSPSESAHHDKFCIDIHHLTLAEATTVVLESVAEWHASQHFGECFVTPFVALGSG